MIAQVITYLRERSGMMKWIFIAYLGFALVFDFFCR